MGCLHLREVQTAESTLERFVSREAVAAVSMDVLDRSSSASQVVISMIGFHVIGMIHRVWPSVAESMVTPLVEWGEYSEDVGDFQVGHAPKWGISQIYIAVLKKSQRNHHACATHSS